jgi:peroxiredoxin
MSRLDNGQPFPSLEVAAVGGGTISLPDDLAGSYGVVLIYRGSWCPYCNAQLAAFSRAFDALTELDVKVVALSVDDEETSAALVAKHKLRFPVGHGADAGKVAAATGAYVNDEPHYLQSTGFVLAPDGTVQVAVYSSDGIGRLVADDVAGLVSYLKSQQSA